MGRRCRRGLVWLARRASHNTPIRQVQNREERSVVVVVVGSDGGRRSVCVIARTGSACQRKTRVRMRKGAAMAGSWR